MASIGCGFPLHLVDSQLNLYQNLLCQRIDNRLRARMKIFDTLFGSPLRVVVAHAARARKPLDLSLEKPISRFTTLKTDNGEILDSRDYFIVVAEGGSLAHRGVPNNSRMFARYLSPELLRRVAPGAMVVVNAKAEASNTGRRLRVFKSFDGKKVTFEDDASGEPHSTRNPSDLEGVITNMAASF